MDSLDTSDTMNGIDRWQQYRESGDLDIRDRLIEENIALVHHIARALAPHAARGSELDELVSAGSLGLIQAVQCYDPSQGASFSTFAAIRIRGAMIDARRQDDHAPRSLRRKQRDLTVARDALTGRLGRAPRDTEVAGQLGTTVETVRQWELDARAGDLVSIDAPVQNDSDRLPPVETFLTGDDGTAVVNDLDRRERAAAVRRALETLKPQEKTVLGLYYFEELKLRQIAEVLGVTESRVSQVRTRALARLRDSMAPPQAMAG